MGVSSSDADIQFPRGPVSSKSDLSFLKPGEFAVDDTGGDVYVRFQDTGDPNTDIVLVGSSGGGGGSGTGGSINDDQGVLSAGDTSVDLPFSVDLETNLVVGLDGAFQFPTDYSLDAAGDTITFSEAPFTEDVEYLVKEIEPGTGNGGLRNEVSIEGTEGQTLFDPGFDVRQDGSDSVVFRNTAFQFQGSNRDYTITQVGNIEFNSPLSDGELVHIQQFGGSFEGGAGSINEENGTILSGNDTINTSFGIQQEDHIFLSLDGTFRPSDEYTLTDSTTITLSSAVTADTDYFLKAVAPGDGRGGILQKYTEEATQDQTTVDPGFSFEADGLDLAVMRNGNVQEQGSSEDYTISGGTVVFNSGLNSGDDISIWKFGGGSKVASHGDSHIGSLESTVNDPVPLSVSNQIINGGFRIWQRGTSFTNVSSYTADKWEGVQTDGTINAERVMDSKYGDYAIEVTDDDGTDNEGIGQSIEGISELAGRTVSVSGWVKEGSGTPLNQVELEVQVRDGGGSLIQTSRSVVSLSSEFRRVTTTLTLEETADDVRVLLRNNENTTGSMIWDGVTLVPGDKPLDYPDVVRPIAQEQSLAERYYESGIYGPTNEAVVDAQDTPPMKMNVQSEFSVTKSAAPTITVSDTGQWFVGDHTDGNAYASDDGANWSFFPAATSDRFFTRVDRSSDLTSAQIVQTFQFTWEAEVT